MKLGDFITRVPNLLCWPDNSNIGAMVRVFTLSCLVWSGVQIEAWCGDLSG